MATAVLIAVCASVAYAGHEEIPRISVADLKKMMDANQDVVVIDAQLKEIYDKGHIKGAVNLPWKMEITAIDARDLPKDKPIVVYCDCGPGETDSADEAAQLTGLGFPDVKVLADPSIRGWTKAGYPMEK
jgi:rhodanese-related sulfurtransferase